MASRMEVNHVFKFATLKILQFLPPDENGTTSVELTDVGRKLFGRKYLGTFAQDQVKLGPDSLRKYQIINTDLSVGDGEHWVALYRTPKTLYVYDSYGRPTKDLLRYLTARAKEMKLRIADSRYDAEQEEEGEYKAICGQLCLAWLYALNKKGPRLALKI